MKTREQEIAKLNEEIDKVHAKYDLIDAERWAKHDMSYICAIEEEYRVYMYSGWHILAMAICIRIKNNMDGHNQLTAEQLADKYTATQLYSMQTATVGEPFANKYSDAYKIHKQKYGTLNVWKRKISETFTNINQRFFAKAK